MANVTVPQSVQHSIVYGKKKTIQQKQVYLVTWTGSRSPVDEGSARLEHVFSLDEQMPIRMVVESTPCLSFERSSEARGPSVT